MSEARQTEILEKLSKLVNSHGKQALYVDSFMINECFTEEYSEAQSAVPVITPPEGYRVCVREVSSHTDGNTGVISLDFATSEKKVYKHYCSVNSRDNATLGHIIGAVDEPLSLTTTTSANKVFVTVMYTLHD